MLIAFIGDMRGRAFHAPAAIVTLQQKLGSCFELVIQVGDFGYPDVARADEPTKRYLAVDPAEADLRPRARSQRRLEAYARSSAARFSSFAGIMKISSG